MELKYIKISFKILLIKFVIFTIYQNYPVVKQTQDTFWVCVTNYDFGR